MITDKIDILNLIDKDPDAYFMYYALKEAEKAYREGEVPIGAIAIYNNNIIAKAYNQVELLKDATAHAEMILMSKLFSFFNDWRLKDVTIYVTKEPCSMCAGAMVNARVKRVVFGVYDKKYGAAGSVINVLQLPESLHKLEYRGGVLEEECLSLLQSFFHEIRG